MSDQTKIQAIIDYGERLKIRSENDILYQKITTFWHIQIRNIVLLIILIWYFRDLILKKNHVPQTSHFVIDETFDNYSANNIRFLM